MVQLLYYLSLVITVAYFWVTNVENIAGHIHVIIRY